MKIGLKLNLGFGIIIIFMIVLIFLSISSLIKIEEHLDNLILDKFPKTMQCNDLIDNYNLIARCNRNINLLPDDESAKKDIQFEVDRIIKAKSIIETKIDTLTKTVKSKEGKLLFNNVLESKKLYDPILDSVVYYGVANFEDDAKRLIFGDLRKAQAKLFDNINILIKHQNDAVIEVGMETDDDNSAAFRILIIIGAFSLILAIVIAFWLTRIIVRPIARAVSASDSISKGDLNVDLTSTSQDETGQLLSAMKTMSNTINNLVKELNIVSLAATEGKLDKRANEAAFEGEYKSIMKGFNNTLDAVIGPLNVTAEYVDRISKGDIPSKITDEYKGDFNEIKNNLNTCIDAVNLLVKDAMTLSKAAKEGKLDTRADASKHDGDFRAVVQGVNDTLDNVIGPLNVAAEYVDRIAKGDIPPKITDNYNGDFNEIKNNLNQCIDAVNMLVADAGMLAKAAVEGKLDTRADASKHGGDFRVIVQGVNNTLDNVIGPLNVAAEYVDRIAKGDIPPKITDNYNGDFNEIKNNLNQCIDAVNLLVSDAGMLVQAAIAEKFDTRANSTKHSGDFRKIVEGVNKTLDVVVNKIFWFEQLLDAIPSPISVTDLDMNWTFINKAAEGVAGKKRKEVLGNHCSNWGADICGTEKCGVHGLRNGKATSFFNQPGLNMDFKVDTAYILDANGKKIGHIEVVTDVTESTQKALYNKSAVEKLANNLKLLSEGNLNLDFTVAESNKYTQEDRDNFININNNFEIAKNAISNLVTDAVKLSRAAIEGKLDTRADASKHKGDFRAIVQGVNNTLDNVIGPLNVAAEYVDRIAKGDIPPKITDNYNGDFNEIKNNLNTCIDSLNGLINEMNFMSKQHDLGDIDIVINAGKFLGAYKEMAQGVNDMVNGHISVKKKAMACFMLFGNGNLDAEIEKFPGKKAFINDTIEKVRANIKELVKDAAMLSRAAKEGKLDTRADASKHQGDFRAIVQGVNDTLDNVIGPLNVAAEYVDRIAKGDIPPKITDNYNGDFNEIKNNLNQCIDAVNLLVADAGMLVQAAIAEKFDTRANSTKHSGDFRKIVEGVNKTLDVVVNKIFWFEQLLDAIPSPISVTDLDMNWTFINKAAEGVAGKKRKEVLGNHCSNWGADICGTEKCGVHGLIKGKATSFFNQPGLNMDFKVDTAYILDANGDKIGHIEVVTDVTESTQKAQFNKIEVQKLANNLKLLSEGNLGLDFTVADANQYTKEDRENFVIINNNFEIAKNAISNLVKDAAMLSRAAIDGKLDTRADASKHQGDFRAIVQGVNNTLDNVIGPLNVAAEYVDRIAKGDIPPKITDNYNGDFNEIKNNLNQCIDAVNMLVADAALLTKAAIEGKLATRADASKHGGDFRAIVQGVNNTLDNVIGPLNVAADYVDKISKGNIPPKITDNYNGDFNVIKNNLNTCIDAVNMLVADAVMLAKAAADGKLQTRADASKHNGDFREIVEGVNQTLDGVINPLNEAAEVLKQMATGDLTVRMMGSYKGDMEAFKEDINTLGDSLAQLITQVNDAVQSSASSAVEISATAESLAAASQEQSAQADEVASAVEEMSRTVTENAMSANRTADVARANGQVANEGAGVVKQTVTKMRDIADVVKNSAMNIQKLGDSSKQIGEIISVIDDIADQTNLLALNAAIEAARAGEQGRGFAVVADEVRKLAERTTEATKQIASMIKGIQSETELAVQAMNKGTHEVQSGIELADRAGESLNNILTSTQEVLDMINQIAAASEQQSATSEQISKNVMSISKVTGESAQRIEDVAKTSDELAKMTEHLRELMGQFQVEEETANKSFNTRHLSHSPKKQLGSRLR